MITIANIYLLSLPSGAEVLFILLSFIPLMPLYFLPTLIGLKKPNVKSIFWINFLLGWTVAGWVIALLRAVSKGDNVV